MRLSGLLEPLGQLPEYTALLGRLRARAQASGVAVRAAVREAAKPYLVARLGRDLNLPLLVVTTDTARAQEWRHELSAWSATPEQVVLFPAFDALPYEQLPVPADTVAQRVEALVRLHQGEAAGVRAAALGHPSPAGVQGGASLQDGQDGPVGPAPVVVTSVAGLLHMLPPPEEFGRRIFQFAVGQRCDLDELVRLLAESGYERAGLVEAPGQFSRRGGIVDLYPPLAEEPVRLEFFADDIESIRQFDPGTQRSTGSVESLVVAPASELALWRGRDGAARLRQFDLSSLRPEVREEWERQLFLLEQGAFFAEAPFFTRYLLEYAASVLDYVSGGLVVLDEPDALDTCLEELEAQAVELREKHVASGAAPAGYEAPWFTGAAVRERIAGTRALHLTYRPAHAAFGSERVEETEAPGPAAAPSLSALERGTGGASLRPARSAFVFDSFHMAPTHGGRIKRVIDDVQAALARRARVVIVSQQAARLAELLGDLSPLRPSEELLSVPPVRSLTIVHGTLAEGWINDTLDLILFTDTEVFGWAKPRRVIRRRRVARESFLSELQAGNYVVHVEHGIGQYRGLVRLSGEGGEREYLLVQYAGNDRLYVPTDQLDRLEKYVGVGDHIPIPHRLGGGDWERAKNRVKQSVQEIARGLLDLYSAREVIEGHPYAPDSPWQQELEQAFPYVETPDQLEAIADVKADMELPKPMDRIVCGDVGYGKTEVAVRAAFKAVMDGKQAAVLVPTTVLALQHFQTFSERMQPFPVCIELLSRFRTPKEQREVIEGLKRGSVDIVVGTHRLLQKDVQPKDLGLLVIDEEHRFGVLHKELLKRLKQDVDVLTLTATPIPRTLHMSLAGVRDMSVMETPPEARQPIKTYVTGYSEDLVREAILRELDRGGQVYYVHNRVQTIYTASARLGRLVPEARIAVGHGQMDDDDLEQVMVDFGAGRYDMLVCSAIIESGLDIPNVNTIIVTEAGWFGLAQVYQLRGRVGRGAQQAYAYLLYDKDRRLTEQAEKRLRTIFEASDLGAGFKIAMKDLEIRGAGNLLGPEQHGFMNAVGFDLYCRLLAQAVDELRGNRSPVPEFELVIDLPLGAHVPDSYVGDPDLKVRLYRRLANLQSMAEVEQTELEFLDRFGLIPEPVRQLFYLLRVKMLARERFLRGIETQGTDIVIRTSPFVVTDRLAIYRAFGTSVKVGLNTIRLPRHAQQEQWQEDLLKLLGTLRGKDVEPAVVAGN